MTVGMKIGAGIALGLAMIVSLGVMAYVSTQRLIEANRVVMRTHEVLDTLASTLSLLKDAETGARGFVIAGQAQYLEPYHSALDDIRRHLDTLDLLVRDDPAQQRGVERVRELTEERLASLKETIRLRREGGFTAAQQTILSDRDRQIMNEIRAVVGEMESRQRQLLDARNRAAATSARRTMWTIDVGMVLGLVALGAAGVVITRAARFAGPGRPPRILGETRLGTAGRYLLAVIAVGLAAGLRSWLLDSVGPMPTFITFYPAVILAASIGGGGPGVLATLLAALAADYWFIPPYESLFEGTPADILSLGIFTGVNLCLCALAARLHRARWAEAVNAAQEEELALLNLGNLLALDLDYRITHWSEGARRLYGYEAQETEGRATHDLFQTHLPQPREQIRRTLMETGSWQGELVRHRKDGEEVIVAILWALRRDNRGKPLAILEVGSNITELKRAESALRASLDRYRSFLEVTGQVGWTTDANGEVVEDMPVWRRFTGQTVEDILGWGWSKAVHPDDLKHTSEVWRAAVEGRTSYETEYRLRRHDGVYRDFLARGVPALNDDGSVREWVGTCIDITERKQAEEALRESQRRMDRAQEIAHLGSWELDIVNNRLFWSDEVYRIFGLQPQAFAATYESFLEAVHPDDRAAVDEAYTRSLRENRNIYEIEHRVVRKGTGEVRTVYERCEHIRAESGRIVRSIGMVHDITERKEAMETLRRTAEDLARSNKDLEQFAYVASHDLQEPLRTVAGYLQLIERRYKSKLDKDGEDFISFAVEGARRLQQLISDLLNYSRVGTRGLPFGQADCNQVLKDVLDHLSRTIRENEAVITYDPLPTVWGDRTQLAQLFQNLIGNAIKFRGDKPPRIHVSALRVDGQWQLSVRDNGIGMEPQYFHRIFTVFRRLHSRDRYPGTGIGLAICKKIVERHGGRIWVESELGNGSIFYFTLPGEPT